MLQFLESEIESLESTLSLTCSCPRTTEPQVQGIRSWPIRRPSTKVQFRLGKLTACAHNVSLIGYLASVTRPKRRKCRDWPALWRHVRLVGCGLEQSSKSLAAAATIQKKKGKKWFCSFGSLLWRYFAKDQVDVDALALAICSDYWVEYECHDCCSQNDPPSSSSSEADRWTC